MIEKSKQVYLKTCGRSPGQKQVEKLTEEAMELTQKVEEFGKLLEETKKVKSKKTDACPKRVPVSGKVLIDGKPLTQCFIRFLPEGKRSAWGKIGPGGKFELNTFKKGDGVVPGKHKVTINTAEALGPSSLRWHAPKKYASPKTSGLIVTVDDPTDSLIIELTWGKEKPFVEVFEPVEEQ